MDTKDLIKKLRDHDLHYSEQEAAADALERLTQPVGEVEPVAWMLLDAQGGAIFFRNEVSHAYAPPLYSAQTVARLIAERDAAISLRTKYFSEMCEVIEKNDSLQEQVKVLRELVRGSTEYRLGVPAYEIAATEPKDCGCSESEQQCCRKNKAADIAVHSQCRLEPKEKPNAA